MIWHWCHISRPGFLKWFDTGILYNLDRCPLHKQGVEWSIGRSKAILCLVFCQRPNFSSKEQENRLWCIQLALKPDVQHKITSNRLRPYCIGYFFIVLTTNSPIAESTWKGQAAGNSKKFWPSPFLKAEMLLDTPIAASHGSLLAYHQNVYKPTAYTYTYMSDRLARLESALNTASMMQCDGSW